MLPDSENPPALLAKRSHYELVAGLIARKFSRPECSIGGGLSPMVGTAVPEAAIYKNGHAAAAKYEIGIPEKFSVTTPAANAVSAHEHGERELRGLVAGAANARHDL